ncbi:MAG: FHA domain-containing protein [Pyrinomonadaceae bacterium]
MTEDVHTTKKNISPDWLVRGVLTKLGDTFDRLTGRGWKPSSSLATSELIETLKRLLDSEIRESDDKRKYVPHNIRLRMQWDKFSTDSDEGLNALENELLTAAVDHINDRRYYTFAPLSIEAKPDYFTTGVKLYVSFDILSDDERAAELNVSLPEIDRPTPSNVEAAIKAPTAGYTASFTENRRRKAVRLQFAPRDRRSIGRSGENDISIDDASISKVHASMVMNGDGQLLIADTGSTNGTFINGERIAYGKAMLITTDDKLMFGTVEVMLEPVSSEGDEPAVPNTVSIGEFEFSGKFDPEHKTGEVEQ